MAVEGLIGAVLLGHAVYTDLRERRIHNRAVLAAAVAGVTVGFLRSGWSGLLLHCAGMAAGLPWWAPVALLGLGPGDAKLAMALGAVWGPRVAVWGPAAGFVLCALALVPWWAWSAWRGRPWRGRAIPMAPWMAAGTALALVCLR
jgi:Flp pilus assembly protein protease CpaA